MDIRLPFLDHLGAKVEELGEGFAVLRLEVKDYHLQHLGYVHGGVISSLADNTGWYAVLVSLPENHTTVTIEIKVNYLKPALGGILRARGKVLRLGKRVAFAVIEVLQEGELIAYATGTYAVLPLSPERESKG